MEMIAKYYLTKEGLKKLQEEYEKLRQEREKKMAEVPPMIDLHGPDSEYLTIHEELSMIEAKMEELEEVLQNVELIKLPPKNKRNEVHPGAIVEVEIEGRKETFKLVGSLEADPLSGKISFDSPVGKALLGKRKGETVYIEKCKAVYKIKKIIYK